ncbi:MAG: ferritin-like domain-containing protein [Polyangiales bacterium]
MAKRKPVVESNDHVRRQWLMRVEAEYRSAILTQELTLWLMQAGASPDLLRDGLRIAEDELVHSELSMETYLAAGGDRGPTLARESLSLPRRPHEPLENDILRAGVDAFCLGETVAVPLFKNLRDGCTVPVARKALDRILRDEVRHRAFGWTLLEWLLETPSGPSLRTVIGRELAHWFGRIRRSYAPAYAVRLDTVSDVDRAWGLMAPARYAAVVERTWERDWQPRFARLGVDAAPAWEAARTAV